MERKYPSYIKEWRKAAGLTQQQLCERLTLKAGDPKPNDETLAIPTTTASLSRIENGAQNFNMATLIALADILGAEEPGWLLDRSPLKEGQVIQLRIDRLSPDQAKQALAVIDAMFVDAG